MILHQVGVFQYHLWLQNYLKMKYLSSMKKVCIHLRKMSQLFLYFTGIVSGLANFFLFRRSSPFVPFQTGDATVIFGRVKYEFAGTRTLCLAMKWFYVQMCVFGTNTWYSCKAWFLGVNTTFFLLPFRYFIKLNFNLTLTNSVKTYDTSLWATEWSCFLTFIVTEISQPVQLSFNVKIRQPWCEESHQQLSAFCWLGCYWSPGQTYSNFDEKTEVWNARWSGKR